jgi:hypothetical protein
MRAQNKFASFTATLVTGGTLALANNIGFRGNCEIHENEPACNGIGSDVLHVDHEMPYAFGTDTTTATGGTGPRTGNATIVEGPDRLVATATIGMTDLPPAAPYQQPVDEHPNLLMSTLA